jgi:NADPH:quinone reductase-like Zn-dependent oxidoreductase
MKAVICTGYGPARKVLEIQEVEKPTPKDNEVLIKIYATTCHIGDSKVRRLAPGLGKYRDIFFKPFMRIIVGFRGPRNKILGMDLAGVVEGVGKNVKKFKKGDEVFASTGLKFGAHAQFFCMNENHMIAKKPKNMSFEEAAPVVNGADTALKILQKANIKNGQKILIYGASGSIGTYAVQIAKNMGAYVTGVCSSLNIKLVKSLGADEVIDYTKQDFTKNGEKYDVIFDAVGKIPHNKRKVSLAKNGIYLNSLSSSNGIKQNQIDLIYLKDLCEKGKLKSVIDRRYNFDEIVEAYEYVDQGHKKGNVIIKVI